MRDDPTVEAARAVRAFLLALGLPVDDDPELRETPSRVARAFADELLDGYRRDPAAALAAALPSPSTALVAVTGVRYVSVCPHHLLPAEGVAAVGYLPGGRIVGLGDLAQLVETFAHRLTLQESLGQQIADALVEHLGARAAGVSLRARHACLSLRGERQSDAAVTTQAFAGRWRDDVAARAEFLVAVAGSVEQREWK